jgi:hypothetical protein
VKAWRAERPEPVTLLEAAGQGVPLTLREIAGTRHSVLTDRRRFLTKPALQRCHML